MDLSYWIQRSNALQRGYKSVSSLSISNYVMGSRVLRMISHSFTACMPSWPSCCQRPNAISILLRSVFLAARFVVCIVIVQPACLLPFYQLLVAKCIQFNSLLLCLKLVSLIVLACVQYFYFFIYFNIDGF